MNLSDFIPAGLTEDEFFVLGASLSVFLICIAIWYSLLETDPSSKKVKEMSALRQSMRDNYLNPIQRKKITDNSTNQMRKVVEFFKLLKNEQAEKLAFSLSKAGRRTPEALYRLLFYKLVAPIVAAAIAYLYIYVLKAIDLEPMAKAFVTILATFIGAKIPDILLKKRNYQAI